MSEETRRVENAAHFLIDTLIDVNPREAGSRVSTEMVAAAVNACLQVVAWPTYTYTYPGPVKWKHGPEKEDS